jgi:hypothetical protein
MSEKIKDPNKKIRLLEAKFEALEKSHKRLAEAHFGDTQKLQDFLSNYAADVVANWPEECK